MKDFRYLNSKDKFLEYAYLSLAEHFPSRNDFDAYFNAIQTDEQKNHFLRTASFYLFLVKKGDWIVHVPCSNKIVDYFTNTFKYIAIFSLIESLLAKKFIDFYSFIVRHKTGVNFPIQDKKELEKYYEKYKEDYGSIRQCISFFKSLRPERQKNLISKLQVKNTEPSIENLAKYLYEMRSSFVHKSELILFMSEGTVVGRRNRKVVICNLSMQDAMAFFEEGLIAHFSN